MKKVSLLAVLIMLTRISMSQITPLPDTWLFHAGDDSSWKNNTINESGWTTVSLNNPTAPLTIKPEHSYGWFRVHFDLSPAMQAQDLMFLLGTIDDVDETYLNGVLIGQSGKFPPADQSAWDMQRRYKAIKTVLQQHNTLAIRVYNAGVEGGISAKAGNYAPRLSYMPAKAFPSLVKNLASQKHTYDYMTTSNGLIAAVYNSGTDEIDSAWPHIFNAYDSGLFVQPFATHIKLRGNYKSTGALYFGNTHIIQVNYPGFTLYYFAPFTTGEKILYAMARGNALTLKNLEFSFTNGHGQVLSNTKGVERKGEKYFLFSFNDSLHQQTQLFQEAEQKLKDPAGHLMEEEFMYMKSVFSKCNWPEGISLAERHLLQQSVSILKMSQVDEHEVFPYSHGQILASLRPGNWAISWVRDASYAIEAMTTIGLHEEARRGLEFMLKATPTDQFIHYIHSDGKDYGIGVPYLISVTRYFGNGREESDYGETNGPNIEIDDFGLFLTAFADYVNQSHDTAFLKTWLTKVNITANAIRASLDNKSIIRRDSGPWEHHLPGHQFVFTNAVCARGLQLLGELESRYNLGGGEWISTASAMKKAILENYLTNESFFKGNTQDTSIKDHYFFDGASIEVFANGLINDPVLFRSHMTMFDKILRGAHDPSKGFIRFDSDDSYENQEWPFAGLRVAVAECLLGDRTKAKKMIDRITNICGGNYNQIPEIISLELQRFKGSIPMVGYGAGAYILAVFKYYTK